MNALNKIGYKNSYSNYIKDNNLDDFTIGRIVNQQKERYQVFTEDGIFSAEITGNLRYSSQSKSDFPVVGDWVFLIGYDDLFLIQSILPRQTILERKAIDSDGEVQVIASNIDVTLIIQSFDNDFNINRLERYVTVANAGNIRPVIIFNKSDLISQEEINSRIKDVKNRIHDVEIIVSNTIEESGVSDIIKLIEPTKTYCFLGSSGVGKSSIINQLAGKEKFKTNEISDSTNKGKHTTTHRELILLEKGGIVIDTPGMRELGIIDSEAGLEQTFDAIIKLSKECKYQNCTHTNEPGCAVILAVENEEIDFLALENYKKLERESNHFKASKLEKRKKDKEFGKMVKEVMKEKRKNKF
jgi:ribosome biogenesis GTPase / thiamine phosphate phosphatase